MFYALCSVYVNHSFMFNISNYYYLLKYYILWFIISKFHLFCLPIVLISELKTVQTIVPFKVNHCTY